MHFSVFKFNSNKYFQLNHKETQWTYYHYSSNNNTLHMGDTSVFKAFHIYHHRNTINVILFVHKSIVNMFIKLPLLAKSLNFSVPTQKMRELDYIMDKAPFQSYYIYDFDYMAINRTKNILMKRKFINAKYNKLIRNE